MPTRTNKRVIYAHQAVAIRPTGTALVTGNIAYGVQELGISTNFNNTPYFELGQLEIYEDVEELPDVQITISKALDGKPLLYHLATSYTTTPSPTLAGRQNNQSIVTVGIYPDTNDYSTGTPPSVVECSGMFPSSLQYSFPVDGTFTESLTMVGNDKLWKNDGDITNSTDLARANALTLPLTTQFSNDTPRHHVKTTMTTGLGGTYQEFIFNAVQRRQHLNFTPWQEPNNLITRFSDVNGMCGDTFCTVLPPDIDGISSSGINNKTDGTNFDAHVQNIQISVDLGRDQLNELGRRGPYHRYINFPVEVTCSVETITSSGDMVSATEGGILSSSSTACATQTNLSNRTIRVATCHKEVFYLGTKNKLTSVELGGGGTDGSNKTATYNFRNYNTLTIMALSDPHDDQFHPYNAGTSNWWNLCSASPVASGSSCSLGWGGDYLVNIT